MIINGIERGFAYTVGVAMAIEELWPGGAPKAAQGKFIVQMAILMSEAYEKRKKLDDEAYEPHPLTWDDVTMLDAAELTQLSAEVDKAYLAGMHRTVETKPLPRKKTTGKVRG